MTQLKLILECHYAKPQMTTLSFCKSIRASLKEGKLPALAWGNEPPVEVAK